MSEEYELRLILGACATRVHILPPIRLFSLLRDDIGVSVNRRTSDIDYEASEGIFILVRYTLELFLERFTNNEALFVRNSSNTNPCSLPRHQARLKSRLWSRLLARSRSRSRLLTALLEYMAREAIMEATWDRSCVPDISCLVPYGR